MSSTLLATVATLALLASVTSLSCALLLHFHLLTFVNFLHFHPGCESAAQRASDWLRRLPPWAVWPPGAAACLQDLPEPPYAVLQRGRRGAAATMDGRLVQGREGGGASCTSVHCGESGGGGGGAGHCSRRGRHVMRHNIKGWRRRSTIPNKSIHPSVVPTPINTHTNTPICEVWQHEFPLIASKMASSFICAVACCGGRSLFSHHSFSREAFLKMESALAVNPKSPDVSQGLEDLSLSWWLFDWTFPGTQLMMKHISRLSNSPKQQFPDQKRSERVREDGPTGYPSVLLQMSSWQVCGASHHRASTSDLWPLLGAIFHVSHQEWNRFTRTWEQLNGHGSVEKRDPVFKTDVHLPRGDFWRRKHSEIIKMHFKEEFMIIKFS